jgi:hypothetical protein
MSIGVFSKAYLQEASGEIPGGETDPLALTMWINVYRQHAPVAFSYHTRKEADEAAAGDRLTTLKISIPSKVMDGMWMLDVERAEIKYVERQD